jgi:hypothetical protein
MRRGDRRIFSFAQSDSSNSSHPFPSSDSERRSIFHSRKAAAVIVASRHSTPACHTKKTQVIAGIDRSPDDAEEDSERLFDFGAGRAAVTSVLNGDGSVLTGPAVSD